MKSEHTSIEGCQLIRYEAFEDDRGTFLESYNYSKFMRSPDLQVPFVFKQNNLSYSDPGVLRGLHIQTTNPQGKLIIPILGVIYDVCLDLRRGSKTFGKHVIMRLSAEDRVGFYVPAGCAHGFYSPVYSVVHYMCTNEYDKESDGGVNAFDPALGIAWPERKCIMSEKDKNLPKLDEWREKNAY